MSWTCPRCERTFANTNQAHACQRTTLAEHLVDKTDFSVAILDRVIEALEAAGEFRIHAQKTRVAFISRMTFAGCVMAKRWVDLSFVLPEPLDSERMRRLELYGPTSWGHVVRLHDPDAVDSEVRNWLEAALLRGDQETLDPRFTVAPLNGRQLEVFWTGFRGEVTDSGAGLGVELPGHVAAALELVADVAARIGGVTSIVALEREQSLVRIPLGAEGLVEGDHIDVFLTIP